MQDGRNMRHKRENDDVKLRHLLTTAARRLAAVQGPIRSDYEDGSEVAHFVLECRNGIEHGTLDLTQEEELVRIFAPSGDWDKVVGDEELGNEVFALLGKTLGQRREDSQMRTRCFCSMAEHVKCEPHDERMIRLSECLQEVGLLQDRRERDAYQPTSFCPWCGRELSGRLPADVPLDAER